MKMMRIRIIELGVTEAMRRKNVFLAIAKK